MIIAYTSAQHAFAGETFLKTSESVIITERAFHAHLMLHWIDRIMVWTSEQHVFSGETFFKIDESVITTQKSFHAHFMWHWNDAVLYWMFNPERHDDDVTVHHKILSATVTDSPI